MALDFARLGFRATPLMSDGRCELTMTLDSRTFLAHVGELEKIGLINRDEAPKRIDAMPDTLAMAFLLQMAPGQTEKLYRSTPMADLCHFTQYLTAEADGIDRPLRVLTYDFTRDKFDHTDWAAISSERFIRSTAMLRFDHDFQKRLQAEGRRR